MPVWSLSARRAWIEIKFREYMKHVPPSLSARRAWIEISMTPTILAGARPVALRKESVDRNARARAPTRPTRPASLSARRAWIEITQFVPITTSDVVALRKESVDRNRPSKQCAEIARRRSPQGERG